MKVKYNSDDDLPLNKALELHEVTIIIRPVFEEGGKFYAQAFQTTPCINYRNTSSHKTDEN